MSRSPRKKKTNAPLKAHAKTEAKAGAKAEAKIGTKVRAKTRMKAGAKTRGAARAEPSSAVIDRMHALVTARRHVDPKRSHSARLLERGTRKVAQKLGEETFECLIEAIAGDRDGLIGEGADVLYHLVVLWVDQGIQPADVWAELARREGTSGIAEKAARPKLPGSTSATTGD